MLIKKGNISEEKPMTFKNNLHVLNLLISYDESKNKQFQFHLKS